MTLSSSVSAPATPYVDAFERRIDYLRVSVTDRCNYRCAYCMGEAPVFLPKRELLTLEEIDRLASIFVTGGVRRLRLTGGEPLARRGLVDLAKSLSRHIAAGALDEITLTTNGSLLVPHAAALFDAGVRRINVSLDTLDPEVFARVTGGGRLADVLRGLDAARAVGFGIRLNAVVMAGVNAETIEDLVLFAHRRDMSVALIETMPIGRSNRDTSRRYVPLAHVREALARRWTLVDLPDRSHGPARYVRVEETGGRLGFITPMSHGFCRDCNRVRIAADGRLATCLGRSDGVDLKPLLRSTESDEALREAIAAAIARKPQGHVFDASRPDLGGIDRAMWSTGG
ncbi:MAG: GTP 3',8-cyclase MoaA [Phyllobacteriaceae bacterium]|nr:GTP 3',8-cyclase MoaA [Phyllobacteriaceae bacterium]